MKTVAILVLSLAGATAAAAPPELGFPAACTLGTDCWIVNYVDDDPAKDSARDFRCGAQTYEGHDGVDIAIRDWQALRAGVDVLAATEGTVLRVRDGVEDRELSRDELEKVLAEHRACGNGVYVDNGDGWQTIYCHMKQGSVVVKPGDLVHAGQKLGQVGHTGYVEFPHVHLGIKHDKRAVDPFTGLDADAGCGHAQAPLWRAGLGVDYQPVSIYAAGFRDAEPDLEQVKRDASSPATLPHTAPLLAFWAALYGVAAGDRIEIEIHGPDGKPVAGREITQDRSRARQFYFVGRRAVRGPLPPGTYTGSVRVTRAQPSGEPITRALDRSVTLQ